MDRLTFHQFLRQHTANIPPEQAFERVARNKVEALNAMSEADDGTGIDCPVCKGKGWFFISFLLILFKRNPCAFCLKT